jgi:hypothetical protein
VFSSNDFVVLNLAKGAVGSGNNPFFIYDGSSTAVSTVGGSRVPPKLYNPWEFIRCCLNTSNYEWNPVLNTYTVNIFADTLYDMKVNIFASIDIPS